LEVKLQVWSKVKAHSIGSVIKE